MGMASRKLKLLSRFTQENGWFLLSQKMGGAFFRRIRDRLLAAKLKTSGMKLGKDPRMAGLSHIRLGNNFSAGNGLWLEAVTFFNDTWLQPRLTVGANCSLSDYVHIGCANRIAIGDEFLCGSRVIISDHNHGVYSVVPGGPPPSAPTMPPMQRPLSQDKSVRIGNNVWIGDGAAILGGADIGDGVIIGANAVVIGKIPSFTIAVGTPAKPIKHFDFENEQWIDIASS
jgi:lipopolysaccharide O-acetyltransferase